MKFSQRISLVAPSLTLQITARAKELKAQGNDVIGFGAGEPDFDTPDFIKNAAKDAIDKGLTKYTPSIGTLQLRQAICEKFKRDNNLSYEPAQIIVTSGAKYALYNLFQTILDPNDEILLPAPYWVSYPEMAKLCQAEPVIIDTEQKDDYKVTVSLLKEKLTPKTKALVLNSPSNPTGTVYTKDEITQIAQFCAENNILLISDEIYEKLIYDGNTHFSAAQVSEDVYNNTVVINGVSKAFSMTGWRIGYAAGPKELIAKMKLLQDHSTSNPCSISQAAALAAVSSNDDCIVKMRDEFQQRRDIMINEISKIDQISCYKPQGAFYMYCDISRTQMQALDFAKKLLEQKFVAVIPGDAFGSSSHIRLSFAVSRENIVEGIKRIKEFLEA